MTRKLLMACIIVLASMSCAVAAISPEEANKLGGQVLTAVGGEKAGSKDGLVAPYTGGITKGADGWYYEGKLKVPFSKFDPKKNGLRPDPFADDKPLFSINAKNMAQYADKLSEGTKALLQKYPDYRIDVYPCRRPAAYSETVAEGTKKAATTARLENEGTWLKDAKGGFPFPIPKSGIEALWNHIVKWIGYAEKSQSRSYVITSAGRVVWSEEAILKFDVPYWDPGHPAADKHMCRMIQYTVGPPHRNGEKILSHWPYNAYNPVWLYFPGQRRVKIAPEVAYDTPNPSNAGANTYDDAWIYQGTPDKYNWKLLGKKEMVVPYNRYKLVYHTKAADAFGPHFMNPGTERWEIHRVWAIEGDLKPGLRHIYKRRVVFLDEDTWQAIMHDEFDNKDKIYRVMYSNMLINYDFSAPSNINFLGYDLITGIYWVNSFPAETGGVFYTPRLSEAELQPASMAGSGVR